jgi:hypothetical protein
VGSNDVTSWQRYATAIDSIGLVDVYRTRPLFNHPPLMGYLAWLCHRISEAVGLPFSIVFRLPSVAANVGTALLLLKIWQARGADEVAGRAFARYSWSVCAILVGAYHGNTDCLAVFACMACLYLLEVGKLPWRAGRGRSRSGPFTGDRFPPPSLRSVSRRGSWRSPSCGCAFARRPARPVTRRLPHPYEQEPA